MASEGARGLAPRALADPLAAALAAEFDRDVLPADAALLALATGVSGVPLALV
jgi:hypothetical protein